MRRMGTPAIFGLRPRARHAVPLQVALLLAAAAVTAQQAPINPRLPPPPPPDEYPITPRPMVELIPAPPPMPVVPAVVGIPAGTRIAVVLDTPLSTRISKKGQRVSFRTSHWVELSDAVELPPETEFVGTVVEAKRPGTFGRPGTLQVKLERIELSTGTSVPMQARLDSPDANAQGKISADSNNKANVADLAQWAAIGTLGGWQLGGGKGAGYGAAAGAAIGLIIMMSHRGPDLYLEPGMPFAVVLNENVTLSGVEVALAQQEYKRTHSSYAGQDSNASSVSSDGFSRIPKSERPVLKRRPKKTQP